jgi:acetyl esterase/lipase
MAAAGLAGVVSGAEEPAGVRLWSGQAPGAQGEATEDVPTVTVYRAPEDRANGAAVVVCPGGGYGFLAVDHEGKQIAEWFNSLGVTAAVLRYRIAPKYHHPAPMLDVQRAIRLVRSKASEWKIDPKRVGVIGFSAGGHLASTAATHFDAGDPKAADPVDRESCRPDVAILGYPVISMQEGTTHGGSRKNLLGDNPPTALVELMSNELQVTAETPPTFIVQTDEDAAVPAENSLLFVAALRKAKVPVEFHLFEKGQHGLGLGGGAPDLGVPGYPPFGAWPKLCESWLRIRGFLPEAK